MHRDRVAGTISAFMARHPHGRSGAHGVALKMPENRHRVPVQTRSAKTNGTTSPGFCGLPGGSLAQPAISHGVPHGRIPGRSAGGRR
jgi:hypothetical protein